MTVCTKVVNQGRLKRIHDVLDYFLKCRETLLGILTSFKKVILRRVNVLAWEVKSLSAGRC